MLETLENIDTNLLLLINSWHNPTFDVAMWWISDSLFGVPFYILFFGISVHFFGLKKAIYIILVGALAVGLADLASKFLFKEVFLRYRPSHNLNIKNQLHLLHDYHGGMYGFVSSHAANMFAIATSLGLFFSHKNKLILPLLLLWAGLIAYSRMYLGVHYPADIFVGGLLGATIGLTLYKLSNKKILG